MMKNIILNIGLVLLITSCGYVKNNVNNTNQVNYQVNQNYLKARNQFQTKLITKIKAPQEYSKLIPTDTIKVVHYPSGNLQLKGLLETSNIKQGKKSPVLVYLHGGFSLGMSDMYDTQPFIDNGFVVFTPTYRGENGNDGNYELFMGEVDDAKSAVEWIAKQPFTDTDNIYVFGHSVGGGLSLQLSFFPNLPIKQAGSSSGLYKADIIEDWEIPFDLKNKDELKFRLPLLNLDKMARKHVMYIGSEDYYFLEFLDIQKRYPKNKLLLEMKEVKGNHGTSLPVAMKAFLKEFYTPKDE